MQTFLIIILSISFLLLTGVIICWNKFRKTGVIMSFKDVFKRTQEPGIVMYNNGKPFVFIVDTGSSHCVLDKRILSELSYTKLGNAGTLYGVDGNKINTELVMLELSKDNHNMMDSFQVLDMPAFDNIKAESMKGGGEPVEIAGIIGNSFLNKYGFIISYKDYTIRR